MAGATQPSPPGSPDVEATATSSFLPAASSPSPRNRTVSSPLNPQNNHSASTSSNTHSPIVPNPFARSSQGTSRPGSRSSSVFFAGLGNNDYSTNMPASANFRGDGVGTRGSMVLYRLATENDGPAGAAGSSPLAPPSSRGMSEKMNSPKGYTSLDDDSLLPPPRLVPYEGADGSVSNRSSTYSLDDSKYPTWLATGGGAATGLEANPNQVNRQSTFIFRERGLVPYAYDPLEDDTPLDAEDDLHDPEKSENAYHKSSAIPWRGILNVAGLVLLVLGLLMLFVFYPVYSHYITDGARIAVVNDPHINGTGQAVTNAFPMPELIDPTTPDDVKKITSMNGDELELVFSDEFNTDGRTFYPGDDPFWEAVDLWYGVTADMEWYDPSQVTTKNGSLVITMDSDTTLTRDAPESTAPFTAETNHELHYRSGMLQSWNQMCFTGGYIEIAIILPGQDQSNQGYWPGAWTMANLGRPGYPGTTDGMWPYTYDECDVGTFPNQTYKDDTGPPSSLHTNWGRSKYNYELSWLPGQRLSACTCIDEEDHPGPKIKNETSGDMRYRGRGVPELDILEDQFNKIDPNGIYHVVSQSAQFAPFTRDYVYGNSSDDYHRIYDASLTTENTYKGSAIQQAVSSLTRVPAEGFQGVENRKHIVYGFEYDPSPDSPGDGWIIWEVDGKPSHRMAAASVGPDPIADIDIPNVVDASGTELTGTGTGGSGVGQRLVPQEPLAVVLNLGISNNWQDIDLDSLIFPAQMLVDYVRVYQKPGQTNIGCSPDDYPTADYIERHFDVYNDKNATTFPTGRLKNREYDGC